MPHSIMRWLIPIIVIAGIVLLPIAPGKANLIVNISHGPQKNCSISFHYNSHYYEVKLSNNLCDQVGCADLSRFGSPCGSYYINRENDRNIWKAFKVFYEANTNEPLGQAVLLIDRELCEKAYSDWGNKDLLIALKPPATYLTYFVDNKALLTAIAEYYPPIKVVDVMGVCDTGRNEPHFAASLRQMIKTLDDRIRLTRALGNVDEKTITIYIEGFANEKDFIIDVEDVRTLGGRRLANYILSWLRTVNAWQNIKSEIERIKDKLPKNNTIKIVPIWFGETMPGHKKAKVLINVSEEKNAPLSIRERLSNLDFGKLTEIDHNRMVNILEKFYDQEYNWELRSWQKEMLRHHFYNIKNICNIERIGRPIYLGVSPGTSVR